MLSSAILRSGIWREVTRKEISRCVSLLYNARQSSSVPQTSTAPPPPATTSRAATLIANWDRANEKFFGPERDYEKFPHPVQPEVGGKVKLAFIPESWFTAMYPKSGVLGPYIFGGSMVAFLISKEIWVIDHGFSDVICFWGAFYLLVRWVGPYLKQAAEDDMQEGVDYQYNHPLARAKKMYNAQIEHCDREIFRVGGQNYINQSKQENVDLQLEAEYRQRLAQVHRDVKNRLDYALEKETTARKLEQNHMVEWIVSHVKKGITPEQEKSSVAKSIEDLKALAKTHSAVVA